MNIGSNVKIVTVVCCVCMLVTVSGRAENLAVNPGFEELAESEENLPTGWFYFSSNERMLSLDKAMKCSGKQSMSLSAQGIARAHLGLAQKMPVEPNRSYTFTARIRNGLGKPLRGSAYGQIGIEWQDADGKEVSRIQSPVWDKDLSQLQWERVKAEADVPPEAVTACFVVYLYDGDEGGTGGFFVDDVEITMSDAHGGAPCFRAQGDRAWICYAGL